MIEHLHLRNFTIFNNLKLDFSPRINVIIGENGTGKTHLQSCMLPVRRCVTVQEQVPFDKAWLADESDVEHYLKSMRKALLKEIRKGKRIQI